MSDLISGCKWYVKVEGIPMPSFRNFLTRPIDEQCLLLPCHTKYPWFMSYSVWKLNSWCHFLLLLSLLKTKALQQPESASSVVETTSCSALVILALWGSLSNVNRYDSEGARRRTSVLCRKLKNGGGSSPFFLPKLQSSCTAYLPTTPPSFFFYPFMTAFGDGVLNNLNNHCEV